MKIVILMILLGFSTVSMAQKPNKFKTVEIKTSALCGECKERIENKLNYAKGVKFADLDIDTKVVTVKFKTKKLTTDDVKKLISSLGYHANDVTRDAAAFENLPGCCQDPNATCTKK